MIFFGTQNKTKYQENALDAAEYEKGSIKMVDINMFFNAQAYLEIIKTYGGKLLFECELTKKSISEMFEGYTFLKEIILSWSTIKNYE